MKTIELIEPIVKVGDASFRCGQGVSQALFSEAVEDLRHNLGRANTLSRDDAVLTENPPLAELYQYVDAAREAANLLYELVPVHEDATKASS